MRYDAMQSRHMALLRILELLKGKLRVTYYTDLTYNLISYLCAPPMGNCTYGIHCED
jgi:hypothetical protein